MSSVSAVNQRHESPSLPPADTDNDGQDNASASPSSGVDTQHRADERSASDPSQPTVGTGIVNPLAQPPVPALSPTAPAGTGSVGSPGVQRSSFPAPTNPAARLEAAGIPSDPPPTSTTPASPTQTPSLERTGGMLFRRDLAGSRTLEGDQLITTRTQTRQGTATTTTQTQQLGPNGTRTDTSEAVRPESKFKTSAEIKIEKSGQTDALWTTESQNLWSSNPKDTTKAGVNVTGEVTVGQAEGTAGLALDKDGLKAQAGGGVVLAKAEIGAEAKTTVLNDNVALNAQAKGSLGAEADVETSATVGRNGVNLSAGGEAFAGVSGEIKGSAEVAGVTTEVGAEGGFGIGVSGEASVDFNLNKVGVTYDVGAYVGLGGELKGSITVDPGKLGSSVKHGATELVSNVGDGVKDVGSGFKRGVSSVGQSLGWG